MASDFICSSAYIYYFRQAFYNNLPDQDKVLMKKIEIITRRIIGRTSRFFGMRFEHCFFYPKCDWCFERHSPGCPKERVNTYELVRKFGDRVDELGLEMTDKIYFDGYNE